MQAIQDFYIAPGVVVTGDVLLSAGVNIWYGSVLRGDLARITIGPRVNIQDGCIVHTDHDAPLDIEAGVVARHPAPVHRRSGGRGTPLGMGAVLLSGSAIRAACLIAPAAPVTQGRRTPRRSGA